MVVEGPILVTEAIERGARIRELYVDEDRIDPAEIRRILERLESRRADVESWAVPSGTLDRVGDTSTSQGVLAVVERPATDLPELSDGFVLVLAELADPGNVGTLVRSAAAAGAAGVMGIGGVDLSNPKVVRASAGTIFGMPIVERHEVTDALEELRASGRRLVGAVVRGGESHTRIDLDGPVALVLGNEAHGLDEQIVGGLDSLVTIDMAGPAESLNVAMAGTILCFEMMRRGAAPSSQDRDLER